MPQEKYDARKLERELKIKFEWREADKNLEKEERNKPVDTAAPGHGHPALETRSWKGNDPVTPMSAPNPTTAATRTASAAATVAEASLADATPVAAVPADARTPRQPPRRSRSGPLAAAANSSENKLRSASQPAAERSHLTSLLVCH